MTPSKLLLVSFYFIYQLLLFYAPAHALDLGIHSNTRLSLGKHYSRTCESSFCSGRFSSNRNLLLCQLPCITKPFISIPIYLQDKPNLAIELFNEMVWSNDEIDSMSLATAIGACGLLKSLQEGRNVHRIAKSCKLEFDVLVSNSLLKMYIDCGSIREARLVFDQMKSRDEISWTAMVSGYVQKGEFNEGLKLFRHGNGELGVKLFQEIMKSSAKDIDWITYTVVLYARCTTIMVEEVTEGSHL